MATKNFMTEDAFDLTSSTLLTNNNDTTFSSSNEENDTAAVNNAEALANSTTVTRSDGEFARFIMSRMFSSGVQAWWLIGILFVLFVFSTIIMFFGSLLDTKYLFASNEIVTVDSIRRLNEYENLQDNLRLDYPQLEKLSGLVAARHALGDPLIS